MKDFIKYFEKKLKMISIWAWSSFCTFFFPEFTKECSDRYKELQGKFEDFQKEKISALYTAFDTVCDGECFPTPKQREQSSKDLLEFDTRVKGWILTMKAKLKKLVEHKLDHLNEQFLQDCKDLNNLKISAKSKYATHPKKQSLESEFKWVDSEIKRLICLLNDNW